MNLFQALTFGKSDIGKKRTKNEDAFFLDENNLLFAVADGIGGLQHGEIASQMAVELFAAHAHNFQLNEPYQWQNLFSLIQEEILKKSRELGVDASMGTTLTCGTIIDNTLFFGHVGDSILYHWRQGPDEVTLKKLTEDHTLEQEWLQKNHLTEAPESLPNFYHHTLTRCMGQESPLEAQVGSYPLEAGDRILLASDGISTGWNMELLAHAIAQHPHPEALIEKLIEQSNRAGGYDNTTALAIFLEAV